MVKIAKNILKAEVVGTIKDAIAIRKKAEQKYFKEYSYENSMNFSKENL